MVNTILYTGNIYLKYFTTCIGKKETAYKKNIFTLLNECKDNFWFILCSYLLLNLTYMDLFYYYSCPMRVP